MTLHTEDGHDISRRHSYLLFDWVEFSVPANREAKVYVKAHLGSKVKVLLRDLDAMDGNTDEPKSLEASLTYYAQSFDGTTISGAHALRHTVPTTSSSSQGFSVTLEGSLGTEDGKQKKGVSASIGWSSSTTDNYSNFTDDIVEGRVLKSNIEKTFGIDCGENGLLYLYTSCTPYTKSYDHNPWYETDNDGSYMKVEWDITNEWEEFVVQCFPCGVQAIVPAVDDDNRNGIADADEEDDDDGNGDPADDGSGDPANDGNGDPANDGNGNPANDGSGDPANDGNGDPADDGNGDPADN